MQRVLRLQRRADSRQQRERGLMVLRMEQLLKRQYSKLPLRQQVAQASQPVLCVKAEY